MCEKYTTKVEVWTFLLFIWRSSIELTDALRKRESFSSAVQSSKAGSKACVRVESKASEWLSLKVGLRRVAQCRSSSELM